ncbi:root hair defective 3 GTP-binding protein [Myriangium duriaei CBS 260.36]|uniref:Root hair defective 3 GTP-binding protein n=1 Tax=Myriangium duriaei CBS 260.36 TaxID=1168546 RepID=A0A9P4J7B6_9PEZI|nr:root hair defective 3 GTP-binding protein [Myriangium duriaei CBS 260.36]
MTNLNGHFSSVGAEAPESFEHGIQIIDEDKNFNSAHLPQYLKAEDVTRSGFNYHIISVFGSQSTGKSTLLNELFGTRFGVMSEQERRQTTKGIWMSKNKRGPDAKAIGNGDTPADGTSMAENILIMDVEGTDGRERGEDQDFERKSALFALATSEVLIVNIWEHQVGLYQGANMGLLKTVFEVNLQLFLKDAKSVPRSLLFFVIRDHIGNTPLANLRQTLLADLSRIWSGLSKPPGLEQSKIEDYFDFAFVALPHKILQPERFVSEVHKLGTRFREGYQDPKRRSFLLDDASLPILLPEYHRRIPADGFPIYAENVWAQIDSNKDLDLPTQQELLAQFRCDEIAKEVLVAFDTTITPLEDRQTSAAKSGTPTVIADLGILMNSARTELLKAFETEASRYHKGVYKRKQGELASNVDARLKTLFTGQLSAAHKAGVKTFSDSVSAAVKSGQRKGTSYDFSAIVSKQKESSIKTFEDLARSTVVTDAPWSNYAQEVQLYKKDLDVVSAQLRKDELKRLLSRIERAVKTKVSDAISLEFGRLGSGRAGGGAPESGEPAKKGSEKEIWDRVWNGFTGMISGAEGKFSSLAKSFDASPEEVETGLWRLRRRGWVLLHQKLADEVAESNLLLKLREAFEDRFRYDAEGVPRVWRPVDDIEGTYTSAREDTAALVPLLSRFKLRSTAEPPPLEAWIGPAPSGTEVEDTEEQPIGGVDDDADSSLEEETLLIPEARSRELLVRFRKLADAVYVEAKRGAIGGVAQVPLYFYGLLLALGWNEIVAVLKNPAYFVLLALLLVGAYVTYTLNLWGPMIRMANAASAQAVEIGKEKLRDFLKESETGRQAMAMSSGTDRRRDRKEEVEMSDLGTKEEEVEI